MATDDRERGWYRKYDVKRLNDPNGRHADCEYFVLDLEHDAHSTPALLAYADAAEAKYPALAADIRRRVGAHSPEPRSETATACDECAELRKIIEAGRSAHNEERVARDWLARENERLREEIRKLGGES
jgi:hypothetical protein